MLLKNLKGTWYNDEYKMIIEDNKVLLNTNINTIHKPFYTLELFNDYITWKEDENTIEISKNIKLMKNKGIPNVIVIATKISQSIQMIRLIKFT